MLDLTCKSVFTPMRVEPSGLTIYLLTRRVAPLQKGFYFVNDSMSADGRYLWLACAHPPGPGRSLAVIDAHDMSLTHFPETQFTSESPFVDPATGEVYWCSGAAIYRRPPDPAGETTLVNQLPEELVGKRTVNRLATHLTRTPAGDAFLVDSAIGPHHHFGMLPVNGGDYQPWYRLDRNHNHAQVCPTDPELVLFAEENHSDPHTGLSFPIVDRMWLLRRGHAPRPVMPKPTRVTHEWWDDDGRHCWCVQGNETWRVAIADGTVERFVFPRHCWHSHHTRDGQLLVGDSNTRFYRGCPSAVHALHRASGRSLLIMENPERHDFAGRSYHIDPHPRFCANDRFVVFTTTIGGDINLALFPTAALLPHLA